MCVSLDQQRPPLLLLLAPLVPHIVYVDATPLPATTITHVQALAVAVIDWLAAVAVVVAQLLLLPLRRRHLRRMLFPPLGAPILEPDLQRRSETRIISFER